MNFFDTKNKERLGVFLLCMILVLSGIILIKDKSNTLDIKENISQKETAATSADVTTQSDNKPISTTNTTKIQAKININTAAIEELDTLPGIGEKTAQKIIDYRKSSGGFKNIEEIKEVSGIGEAKFSQVKDLISI